MNKRRRRLARHRRKFRRNIVAWYDNSLDKATIVSDQMGYIGLGLSYRDSQE